MRSGRGKGTTKMSGGKKGRKEKELDFYVSWCVCLCGGEEAVAARATPVGSLGDFRSLLSRLDASPSERHQNGAYRTAEAGRNAGRREGRKGARSQCNQRACEGTQKRGGGRESAPPLSLSRFAFFSPSAPRSSSTHRILNSQSIKNSPPCRSWAWR